MGSVVKRGNPYYIFSIVVSGSMSLKNAGFTRLKINHIIIVGGKSYLIIREGC